MVPTLIVLFMVTLGVAIVAWAVRRRPARPYAQPLEQDTAWNDPIPSAETAPDTESTAADPFAHAPQSAPPIVNPATEEVRR